MVHHYVTSHVATLSATVKRPADTNVYTANDTWADSTSSPTAGGFTLSNAVRQQSGFGNIVDAVFSTSLGTTLQGEMWIFDQAVGTAPNDNAAFSITAADCLNLIGIIPFNCTDSAGTPEVSYVTGLNIGYNTQGTADLRFLIKVMNAPTPSSQEVLSIRLHVSN